MALVPLHNHSMYSALDGFSTPEEIADRCVEIGCPCCGLTDHGIVSGHLHFAKALAKKNIKPIFGCELYHGLKTTFKPKERDQAHLVALAMTDEGLRNLWRLVHATAREDHFYHVGRVFWEDLEKYNEGLVITSACPAGLVPQGALQGDYSALNHYLDIFGENFYIELHTYPWDNEFKDSDLDNFVSMRIINEALVAIAQERGIPMVYANDAHYAFPWQFEYHDLYLANQTRQSIFTPIEERKMWHPPGALAIMNESEVRDALDYLPESIIDEALTNSVHIAERADAHLPEVRRHLPMFVPGDCPWLDDESKALSPEELFIDLVQAGIVKRYGEDASEEVWDRVVYEVETLIRDGIHHYFLMGWDEIQAARDLGMSVGPGRGSSAGCIVAYALGITDVDPLHYGLIFERFWNSGRAKGFPDIDSDFPRSRRKDLIAYLKKRWGEDKVCAIGTTGFMKPKSVIDKLARGCGIEYKEAEELKEIVGRTTKIEILGHEQIGWTRELEPGKVYYVEECVGNEIAQWIKADRTREEIRRRFIEMCKVCCSRAKQYGIHASGIVISDVPLNGELPAYLRGPKEERVAATMFTMDDVDERMFIKLDVLGLRTLDAIDYWLELVEEYDIDIEWSDLDKQEHPAEMWDLLTEGYTAAIFQVEDGYGRQLCKRMNPRSVEDLSVIGALNRPGPIQAGIPERYIARRSGEEPITYAHPRLKEIQDPILGVTYGLFVYQEQIIAYFNALNYTLSESDAIRKIIGKKEPQLLDAVRDGTKEWEGRGYWQMTEAAGLPHDVAQEVWETIEGFADYCFNKSHTVAYAIVGFRTLFAKYYGPAFAYAASLRSLDMSKDKEKRTALIPMYVNECRRLNIEVRPPDIRYAKSHAYVDPHGRLLFGFGDIKNIGKSGDYIVELRDEEHLCIDTPDCFREDFDQYNTGFLKLKKVGEKEGTWTKTPSPKQRLNAGKIDALEQAGAWDDLDYREITLTQRQENEQEMLGVILTDNSVEVIDRNAEEIASCGAWEMTDHDAGLLTPFTEKLAWISGPVDPEEQEYFEHTVCGIVTEVQEKRSKKSGKPFGIVTIEHDSHAVEFMVFSNRWRSHKFLFKLRNVGIFTLQHAPAGDYPEAYHFAKGHLLK